MKAKSYIFVMPVLLLCASMLSPRKAYSQAESHNFTTYDTVFNIGYAGLYYTLRITRPTNMFVPGDPDTASRPAIIHMNGAGEVGSNAALTATYGPHYWMANGWDGGVQLGNGKHYPIIITVMANQDWPQTTELLMVLTHILNTYHIKRNAVHLCGLSMGAFSWSALICHQSTPGGEDGMKLVTSLVCLEGQSQTVSSSVAANELPNYNSFGHWAKKYHGHFFGLEGINDYRNVSAVSQNMNDSVPGVAYFSYENIGGGNHCCWNSMFDPSATNWTCVGQLGPNNALNAAPNTMGNYSAPCDIFQWMLKQGDTTMVGSSVTPPTPPVTPPNTAPVANAGSNQSITLPLDSVKLTGSATDNGGYLHYQWTEVSGPSSYTIVTDTMPVTMVRGLQAGNYVFQIAVTDTGHLTGTSQVTITVNPAPVTPPVTPPVTSGPVVIKKVAVAEYRAAYLTSDGNVYSFLQSPLFRYDFGARKITDVTGGFNLIVALDDQGFCWTSRLGDNVMTRYETDTTGAPFNNNLAIFSYTSTYISIRSDSSLWYWGLDTFHLYHPVGGNSVLIRPIQLSPAGLKFKKVVMGLQHIIALTNDGQIYEWNRNSSTTPTLVNIPAPASDIFGSHWDYEGCIIPDNPGGTMGYPYVWGSNYGFWGGTGPLSQPTSVKALWNVTAPIKEIATDYNTTHYIDSLGRMFGVGDDVMGEIGNGKELVNQYTYVTPYGWDFNMDEDLTHSPSIQIGVGTKWKKLFSNNFLAFYKYALDENDSLYFWGRDKAMVSGRGYLDLDEAAYPNAWDVLSPLMVHPLSTAAQTYHFTKPSINAGANQNITTTTTTLNGAATPPLLIKATPVAANGIDTAGFKIVSYAWTQVSGPAATIASPASATTAVSGLTPGVYVFNLKTKDSNTGTQSANVTVTVSSNVSNNKPPVANAGPDQTITLPVNTATLVGSGVDSDGTIASYQWTQISGPSNNTIGSSSSATTAVNNLIQGVYEYSLTVFDNKGASGSDTVFVTVKPAPVVPGNPVADAGGDQTITLPLNSVTLTGSGSETNGTIVGYQWKQTSGPSASSIVSENNATTQVSGLEQGVYTFQLTVTDNSNKTATATVKVTVNAAAVVPGNPVASAGGDQTITLPVNTVTLTGSGSETNGTITGYAWTQVSGPSNSTIVSTGQASTQVNNLMAGVYTFQLTITDNSNKTATATVKVTVNAATHVNEPPIANAGPNQVLTGATETGLDGSASYDPDGTIIGYSWVQKSGAGSVTITGANTDKPYLYGLEPGAYQFELTVTDNDNASATATVTITILAGQSGGGSGSGSGSNGGPFANAGVDTTITFPGSTSMLLNGSASYDTSAAISNYSWQQVSGPSGAVIGDTNAVATQVTDLQVGVYVYKLTVTDNLGHSASSTVTIKVLNDLRQSEYITLYPNPAPNGSITVAGQTNYTGKVIYTVYDMGGRLISETIGDKQSPVVNQVIPLRGLLRGVYVLTMAYQDGHKPRVFEFIVD